MAYTVEFTGGSRRSGLASTTACVLAHATVVDLIAQYTYATVSGSTFTFYTLFLGDYRAAITRTLTVDTLASAAVGAPVLIDDGTGKWKLATVVNDGSSGALAPDGTTIPLTTTAAAFLNENGQQPPSAGTALALIGTSSDGHLWFSYSAVLFNAHVTKTLVCNAASTVGALAGTGPAAVQVSSNAWVMMNL